MDDETMRCARCGRPIEPSRLGRDHPASDAAGEHERLCAACAAQPGPRHPAAGEKGSDPLTSGGLTPFPDDQVLQAILREVKLIARNQEYEPFSIWNIFGGLVQCVVLFVLFWHYFKGQPDLLWAVALQLIALTFFVMAKK